MLPTLSLGPIALPTYPLALLIALWVGLSILAWRARQLSIEGDHVYNAGLFGLIGGILGARLWFVLSHWQNYSGDIAQAFSLSRSALSLAGGLIVAGIVIFVYLQLHRVPLANFLDAAAPGFAVALIIGHIGAFLGGEGLGLSTNVTWAVEIGNVARHPVQLYEAVASLLVFGMLLFIRAWHPWPGFQFWLFVALYSLARLLLEIFRARPALIGDGFLAVQIVALGGIIIALAVMAYNFSHNPVKIEIENYEVA